MQKYQDKSGHSGVASYSIGDRYIIIKFADGGTYIYNYASAGAYKIEKMKKLAERGEGLATYINKHIRQAYARKV